MKYLKLLIIVGLFFSGCYEENKKTEPPQNLRIEKEVESLTTIEKQKVFLEEISRLDQKVRNDETSILQQYGYDSKEHKESWKIINETDDVNLDKIELFLKKYGHPTTEKHGELACRAPWLVIHHASRAGARRKNFEHLYTAWKNEDLDGGAFAFYLNRLYAMEHNGKRLRMKNPFTEESEIDTLLEVLNLKKP